MINSQLFFFKATISSAFVSWSSSHPADVDQTITANLVTNVRNIRTFLTTAVKEAIENSDSYLGKIMEQFSVKGGTVATGIRSDANSNLEFKWSINGLIGSSNMLEIENVINTNQEINQNFLRNMDSLNIIKHEQEIEVGHPKLSDAALRQKVLQFNPGIREGSVEYNQKLQEAENINTRISNFLRPLSNTQASGDHAEIKLIMDFAFDVLFNKQSNVHLTIVSDRYTCESCQLVMEMVNNLFAQEDGIRGVYVAYSSLGDLGLDTSIIARNRNPEIPFKYTTFNEDIASRLPLGRVFEYWKYDPNDPHVGETSSFNKWIQYSQYLTPNQIEFYYTKYPFLRGVS